MSEMSEMRNSRNRFPARRAIPAGKPECTLQVREVVMTFIIKGSYKA